MNDARLGIFGGSFDPVHRGHLHVARSAREHAGLTELVFVPAARPPHKPGVRLASGEHRVGMLELALQELGFGRVSAIELEREGPSFTFDTVALLPAELGLSEDVPITLVIGADNLRGLERWRSVEELLERVDPLIVARGEDSRARLRELAVKVSAAAYAKLERGLLLLPTVEIAATELRERLAAGTDCSAELPSGVAEYVSAHGVYGLEESA